MLVKVENGIKTEKNVDKILIATWVEEQMAKMNVNIKPQFQSVYDSIDSLIEQEIIGHGVPSTLYEKDVYQIYIAAHICLNSAP